MQEPTISTKPIAENRSSYKSWVASGGVIRRLIPSKHFEIQFAHYLTTAQCTGAGSQREWGFPSEVQNIFVLGRRIISTPSRVAV